MVKLVKNNGSSVIRKSIPGGAVNMFLKAGWEIDKPNIALAVNEEKRNMRDIDDVKQVESSDEWDEAEKELQEETDEVKYEKPISEMNEAELRKYAQEKGVNLNGLSSIKQIRQAIRAFGKK